MKIVIKCVDGTVQIMTLDKDSIELRGKAVTEELAMNRWKARYPDLYAGHREMPDEAIPVLGSELRKWRAAWTDATPETVIDICMVKARDIHLSRLRLKRNEELAKLDIEYVKTQDMGDDEKLMQIRKRKQWLRDLPKTIKEYIDNAKNIEDLKLINPI